HYAALSERLSNWVTAPRKEDYQMIRRSLPAPQRAPHVVLWVLAVLFTLVVGQAWAVAPDTPRVFLDTTLVAPTGTTIAVSSGGDLQAALNAAQPGDVITLQAGATYTGPFTLPNKTGTGWITVRTSAPDTSLPAPGTRVNPSYATVMPKIVVGGDRAIGAAAGAHHFRFIGLELKPLSGAGENVMFGGADPSITNLVPADIEIRGIHFFKPTAWRGVCAAVKNLFELKNARRVLIEGNIFENNWLAAQAGWAVQFTVRN